MTMKQSRDQLCQKGSDWEPSKDRTPLTTRTDKDRERCTGGGGLGSRSLKDVAPASSSGRRGNMARPVSGSLDGWTRGPATLEESLRGSSGWEGEVEQAPLD